MMCNYNYKNNYFNTLFNTIHRKTFKGKTFTFRVENGYSLENFYVSMLVDLYCQSTRP